MNDKDFFYSLYKETALTFQSEIKSSVQPLIATFPENDPLRLETLRFVGEGGKRLRTVLARVVTKFYGTEEVEATATLDTFHKFLLCHDDVIDRDRMRWGMPTVHVALEDLVTKADNKEHFGNGLAIVSGDLISTMAYSFILNSQLSDHHKVVLMKLTCRAMDEVAWGWYDQFLMDYEPLDSLKLSLERIRESIIWVTGKYTISYPLRFGFAIADKQMPPEMENIADMMGILFQTGDDLIGIFGDSQKSGKSNFGDIVQGKKTLPIYFAYQMSNQDQKARLVTLIGKKDISTEEVEEVREIMLKNGSYAHTQEFMHNICKEIIRKLSELEIPEDLSRFLKGFTLYLVERES